MFFAVFRSSHFTFRPNQFGGLLVPILIFLSLVGELQAHKVTTAQAILYLDTENERTFSLSVEMDVESSGDPALDDEIGPEEAGKAWVENYLLVLIDEKEQPKNLEVELVNRSDEDTPVDLRRLAVVVTWKGDLPQEGKELAIYLKETADMSVAMFSVKNGKVSRRITMLFAGEYSRAENIEPLIKENPFELAEKQNAERDKESTTDEEVAAETKTQSEFIQTFRLGVQSAFSNMLLPIGMLLAFVLLNGSIKAQAVPIVTFLIAHCIGFCGTAMGIIPLWPWSTAVAIVALLLLAIDNLFSFRFRKWRYVAGAAGGFFLGNVLVQTGPIPKVGRPPFSFESVIPFQLGFVATVLAIVLAFGMLLTVAGRHRAFRWVVVIPLSIFFAGVGLFLLIDLY